MSNETTNNTTKRTIIHLWELQLFNWSSVRQQSVVFRCLLAFSSWMFLLNSISIFTYLVTCCRVHGQETHWPKLRTVAVGRGVGLLLHCCSKKVTTLQSLTFERLKFLCKMDYKWQWFGILCAKYLNCIIKLIWYENCQNHRGWKNDKYWKIEIWKIDK